MRDSEIPVTFQPQGRTVHVLAGTLLVEAAAGAGMAVETPCGGGAICGKCRVITHRNPAPPRAVEREHFSDEQLEQGYRLACQATVEGPMTIEVPTTSLLDSSQKILIAAQETADGSSEPVVVKRHVAMEPPSRGSPEADAARLRGVLGPVDIPLELLRSLPETLRRQKYRGTAVVVDGKLIDFEVGQTDGKSFGVAVDLGTTTLAAVLMDLRTGADLAVAARVNPQVTHGDDVLSRIQHASDSPEGLESLNESIVEAVDELIAELASDVGISPEWIHAVTFAGNTTMQSLFCRIDPRYLGQVPFVPAVQRPIVVPAAKLRLRIHPRGQAYLFPIIGGFVGGDTVAGMIATRLPELKGPALLVDIGTNGEIVLVDQGKIWAAAAAAGPAFEGARIGCGMRGSTGAIEKVVVDGHLRIGVIGDVAPVGLCGSGLIDVVAALLDHGVIQSSGRLTAREDLPNDLLPDLLRRVVTDGSERAFVLADPSESGIDQALLLTQADIRQLQLATGAIRAGIQILLKRTDHRPEDLKTVLIAGGFGNFIRRSNAQRIGLLPPEIPRPRIRFAGNTSLAGARLVAVCAAARRTAAEWASLAEHIDLSTDPTFHEAFAAAMVFPDNQEVDVDVGR